MGFENMFNKFAKAGTSINRGANKIIGKDLFPDIKEIEESREFPAYESFPSYDIPEPEQWSSQTGEDKKFFLEGHIISVSANLDACMKYRKDFKITANHYTEQFKFKYQKCIQDYDTFLHYFSDMYLEGLTSMIVRAYSLLLPFGVFNTNSDTFTSKHMDTHNRAIVSYETMAGIIDSNQRAAENLGNQVGGAIQMQGGGFGFKGAMKGVAQAEAFNLGIGLLGKYVASQSKMSKEEKAKVFSAFEHELFFQEVYSDYFNTFLTMMQILSDNDELGDVTTIVDTEVSTMITNLQNPMFPQDKVAPALAKLISANPFVPAYFELLQQKFGHTEEVNQIISYFAG